MVAVLFNAGDQVPIIPLLEVVGNALKTSPEQIGAMVVNIGNVLLLTVTVRLVVVAHKPAVGVKVYVAVDVLLTVAGNQVPVTPFVEVVGKTGATPPGQMGATGLNVGRIGSSTVIVNVLVVAHDPVVGVNVYVVVSVLFIAGLHVPVIPLLEVVGNALKTSPEQIGATAVNVGTAAVFTVMVNVVVVAQDPAFGVKV